MKPNLTFLFVIIGLFLLISNAASAGNTYNFYFAPDDEGVMKSDNVQKSEITTPIATPEVGATYPTKSRDPKRFRGFRLGVAFNVTGMQGVFDTAEVIDGVAYMPGTTFSVKVFPAKYIGLFGEATIGGETNQSFIDSSNRSGFTRLYYNFGVEIVPIRIDFFGIDDLLEVAAEVGFSTLYYSYYKNGYTGIGNFGNRRSFETLNYNEFSPGLFYGPKLRMNMGPAFSLESMMRMSSEEERRNIQFLAGATLNF